MADPAIKWAGGKRNLCATLSEYFPDSYDRYFEPFLGGGALFFSGLVHRQGATLSDINPHLINTYIALKNDVEGVIEELEYHAIKHSRDHFNSLRSVVPDDSCKAAARLIYITKTCFNGQYTEGKNGNVTCGFGNQVIFNNYYPENLRLCSLELQKTDAILNLPYTKVLSLMKEGDLVYCDPPYDHLLEDATNHNYSKEGFKDHDQTRLATEFKRLGSRGVYGVLSNSDTPFIRSLYEGCRIYVIKSDRSPSLIRKAGKKKINELVIINF